MPKLLSADHIAGAGADGAFEPQRTNNFELVVSPPGGGNGDILQLSIKAFPLPKQETSVIEIPYGNEIRKAAGRTTYAPLEATFHDYVDQDTLQILNNWRLRVYNPKNGSVGWAKEYKVEGTLLLFGPDGESTRSWTLKGLWPSSLDPGSPDMENAEKNLISCTFAIDKAEEDTVANPLEVAVFVAG
jgi:hypothetical protein